jgi:methyltransferase (TIGR00027 family)
MKTNEPSRTALMIARQRAAHQVLDHGSILHDPFAMKILHEDENDVLQFGNANPLATIGRLFTTARSRIAEDALSGAVERGIRQIVILGAGLDTFALRSPHGARQIRIYEVDHPATQAWKRQRLAEAQLALPPWLILGQSTSSLTIWGRHLSAQAFSRTGPRFRLARRCAISDSGRYRQNSGLHSVNPELGGRVRLHGTSRGILGRAKAIGNEADRTAEENW